MDPGSSGTPKRSLTTFNLPRTPKRTKLMLDIYKELSASGQLTPNAQISLQNQISKNNNNGIVTEAVGTLRGHFNTITSLKFHPMKNELISAGLDGIILLWDITNPNVYMPRALRFEGNKSPIHDVTFLPKTGIYMLSGSEDQIARVWTPELNTDLRFVKAHGGPVLSVDWNPSHLDHFITASKDSTVKVWDISSTRPCKEHTSFCNPIMKSLACLTGHTDWVNSAKFNDDGSLIITASQDHIARVWDYRGPNCFQQYTSTGGIVHAEFLPTSENYFGTMTEDAFYIYDLRGGINDKWLQSYTGISQYKLNKFQFHSSGDFVGCVAGGSVKIIDLIQGRPILTIFVAKSQSEIHAIDFAPNVAQIAVGGQQKLVQIFKSPLVGYSNDGSEAYSQESGSMEADELRTVDEEMEED